MNATKFKVVLISPYEIGRQPFALAEPTAWLRKEGFQVECLDLSLQRLEAAALDGAGLVALYLGMHTAARIALEALPRIQQLAPTAHLCVYGLYAPMNAEAFIPQGVQTLLNNEAEGDLIALAKSLAQPSKPPLSGQRVEFICPDRSTLPALERYAHLRMPDGATKRVGFAEGTRGCKHLCRHCPVVPVYQGQFRAIPVPVVMADIRQQVQLGAQHISFGDPDFFNGPTHALRITKAMHHEFPTLTFDATIKVEHLLRYAHLIPLLQENGCLFILSAVESVDNQVLTYLDKGHSRADFFEMVALLRHHKVALAPTFLPFTPWTSAASYLDLLQQLVRLGLVASVPPIQLSIRLLIPAGSYLLPLPDLAPYLGAFDSTILGYSWKNPHSGMDELQRRIQKWVSQAEQQALTREQIFETIWQWAHQAANQTPPTLPKDSGQPIPSLSEPWYCCAEPTEQQLQSF